MPSGWGGKRLKRAGWLEAGQLQPGDVLRTSGGKHVMVVALHWNVGDALVYTLTVENDHTFFVGAARVLVHNRSNSACDLVYDALRDGEQLPVNNALQAAYDFLGPNALEDPLKPGRFISAAGKRVVRLTDSDILASSPHINFTYLEKNHDPRKLGRMMEIGNRHNYLS